MILEMGNKSVTQLAAEYVGQVASVNLDGLMVAVVLKDFRTVWGRTDVSITPENGYGSKWVSIDRLAE